MDFSGTLSFKEALVKLVQGIQVALEGRTTIKEVYEQEPALTEEQLALETQKMQELMTGYIFVNLLISNLLEAIGKNPYLFVCYHWTDKKKADILMAELKVNNLLCYPGGNKVHDVEVNLFLRFLLSSPNLRKFLKC